MYVPKVGDRIVVTSVSALHKMVSGERGTIRLVFTPICTDYTEYEVKLDNDRVVHLYDDEFEIELSDTIPSPPPVPETKTPFEVYNELASEYGFMIFVDPSGEKHVPLYLREMDREERFHVQLCEGMIIAIEKEDLPELPYSITYEMAVRTVAEELGSAAVGSKSFYREVTITQAEMLGVWVEKLINEKCKA